MAKIRDIDRARFPAFANWLPGALLACPDNPALWEPFLTFSDAPAPLARDAIAGKLMSPTLQVVESHLAAGAGFDPAQPDAVSVERRVAERFQRDADNRPLRQFTLAAVLAQIAAWRSFRNGRTDFTQRGQDFAAAVLGRSLGAAYLQLFGDDILGIRMTAQDAEDLIKLTIAEAGGAGTRQGRLGQAGVIFVVLNRVASTRFPNSIRKVIDQPVQFEPILKAPGKSVTGLRAPSAADRAVISAIIDDIIAGVLTDPTNGATFFQNAAITDARGTNFAKGFAPVATIVDHSFYDRFKAHDPVVVPAWRLTRA